jgi:twitching motility protein PilT
MSHLSSRWMSLLQLTLDRKASDLHLTSGTVPYLRINNEIHAIGEEPLLCEDLEALANELLNDSQRVTLAEQQSLDLAFFAPGIARFRVNIYRQRGTMAMALRRLDENFRSFESLNLPSHIEELTQFKDGLVLVTGPTGSGKSTTLATMIHQLNLFRHAHIITIEDPIEYVHKNQNSLIHQRELHYDVPSFAGALKAALREDPDIILVGEMRDLDTIRAAVTAAETGHLVFSTLHTNDAPGTISRIVSSFPAEEQVNVRDQLSRTLRAVVSQRLLKTSDGQRRVPVCEVMRVTTGVANLIRTGQLTQITSMMQTGSDEGMLIIEQSLAEQVAKGNLSFNDAAHWARDEDILRSRIEMLKHRKMAMTR